MIKSKTALAFGVVAVLGLAACGSDDDSSSSTDAPDSTEATDGSAAPADGDCAIGMGYDGTGRGDKSFNDAAGAALEQAQADFGITFSESTPTGEGDRSARLQGLVDEGNGLVQGNGFLFFDSHR